MDTAIISALSAIAGFAASHFTQLRLASEQRMRERDARKEQRVVDFRRWQREQFTAALGNAVRSMNLYVSTWISGKMDTTKAQDDPDMRRLAADMQAALNVIAVIMVPDPNDPNFLTYKGFLDKACWEAVPHKDLIWEARQSLIEHAARFSNASIHTEA